MASWARNRESHMRTDFLPVGRVLVLGVGGTSRDIADMIREQAPLVKIIFLDDNTPGEIGNGDKIEDALGYCALCINGIGSVRSYLKRPEIVSRTGLRHQDFLSVSHPQAYVSPDATIGVGVAIMAGAYVGRAKIGDHVTILPNAIVSHDVSIGDFSIVTGGVCISGNATIGHCCYLGSNCTIGNDVTVGDGCLVGMGSVVLRDVPPYVCVVGNPARYLREAKE